MDCNLIETTLFKPKKRDLSILFHKGQLLLINRTNRFYTDLIQEPDSEEKKALIYDLMTPEIKTSSLEITEIITKINLKKGFFQKEPKINGYLVKKLDMGVKYKRVTHKRPHSYLKTSFEEYTKAIIKEKGENNTKLKGFHQEMGVWVSEEFPLKLKELIPLLKILSKGNLLVKRLMEVFERRKEVIKELFYLF